MLPISTLAVVLAIAAATMAVATEDGRTSAPFDTTSPVGLQTFHQAITSAGFHCPVAQTVGTVLEDPRGQGLPTFVHTVVCRELGAFDVDRRLTYRLQQQDRERRFHVRRLRQTD